MSTRSNIIKVNKDGKIEAIYCHNDGFLEYNGKVLFNDYQDAGKVDQLIKLGDISHLGKYIEVAPVLAGAGTKAFKKRQEFDSSTQEGLELIDYTLAYGRDKGEANTGATTYNSLDEYLQLPDYFIADVYIFNNDKWYYSRPKATGQGFIKPVLLKTALKKAKLI